LDNLHVSKVGLTAAFRLVNQVWRRKLISNECCRKSGFTAIALQ
jgi:hypothetical protein